MLAYIHTSSAPSPEPRDASDFSDLQRATLRRLRHHAARVRVSPRLDLFHACAQIAPEVEEIGDASITALLRCLGQALGHQPVFHRVDALEVSFDEAWLIQLLDRLAAGDASSAGFLLMRRVPLAYRRPLIVLLNGTAAAAISRAA